MPPPPPDGQTLAAVRPPSPPRNPRNPKHRAMWRSHAARGLSALMAPLALALLLLAARRGAAQIFSETSASAVVEELKALHERGTCPDEVLDGVGLTEVADREGGGADGGQHRHLQMFGGSCNPATFAAEAQRVDEACCDADTSCDGGVPAHCDAKCAIVYNDFFEQCQGQLDAFGMADGYEQLFATCSNLPTEALWRAAVQCSGLNICASEPEPECPADMTDAQALLHWKVREASAKQASRRKRALPPTSGLMTTAQQQRTARRSGSQARGCGAGARDHASGARALLRGSMRGCRRCDARLLSLLHIYTRFLSGLSLSLDACLRLIADTSRLRPAGRAERGAGRLPGGAVGRRRRVRVAGRGLWRLCGFQHQR
eukprot:SAG31_NODE_5511_length_2482_cov_13.541196_1_plen_374_part_00